MLHADVNAATCALKANNPGINVYANNVSRVIEYRGYPGGETWLTPDNSSSGRKLSVKIDLHGLVIREAITFLDSLLVHYRVSSSAPSRVDGAPIVGKRMFVVTLVVGKGIHSVGGVARLGPALSKHLISNYEVNCVHRPGELCLKF